MPRLKIAIVICLPLLMAVTACATIKSVFSSPIEPEVVDVAVAAAIGTNKATVVPRAQAIKNIATQLLTDTTALTSLETLEADVNAQIAKLNLPGPDLVLAQALATALEISAQAYIVKSGASTNVQYATTAITTVLNQVIVECKAFGAT